MNEVKTPKKPLIVYYAIAILVVLLINTLLVPMVSQARVKYVDYGTFIQMTEEDKISEVQVQDNQIIFVTKEDEANKNAVYYRTGKMDDPELTSRLSEHGVRFDKEIVEETSPLLSFLLSFVFPIVLFIALGQLLTRQLMKRMGGGGAGNQMNFGKAKVKQKSPTGGFCSGLYPHCHKRAVHLEMDCSFSLVVWFSIAPVFLCFFDYSITTSGLIRSFGLSFISISAGSTLSRPVNLCVISFSG